MAERIQGITIKFTGDTRELSRAINNVKSESYSLAKELRDIDKALKYNPGNLTLLSQKQQVLTQRVRASKDEVVKLKLEQKRLASDNSVNKNSAEWRKLEREIIKAESQMKRAAREMVKFGGSAKLNKMSTGLQTVGKKLTGITRNARLAAGAIAGIALYKGFERLKSLDETSTQLETLGYKGKELEQVMDGVKTSVSGTRFTLQDMAKVASGALGSGVTEDYDLDKYLSRTADLAQLAGISVTDMGGMMNKAYSRGKVDAELMNQLNDRGIPIYKLLQKELGVTAEELQEMSRKGLISFDDLYRATDQYEGLAQDMAMKTLPGAVTVMGQQFGLMGADFLSGAYEPLKEGAIGMLNWMKKLSADGTIKKWGQAVGEAIKYFVEWFKTGEASMDGMSPKAQALAKAFGPLIKILGTVVKFFIQMPAPLKTALALFTLFGGPLLMVAGGLLKIVNMAVGIVKLAKVVGSLSTAFTLLTGINPIALGIVAGIAALAAIAVVLYKNWDKISEWFKETWEKIKEIFSAAWEHIKAGFQAFFEVVKLIITTYLGIWKKIITTYLTIIKTIFTTIWNGIKTVIIKPIQAAWTWLTTTFNNIKIMLRKKMMEIKLYTAMIWQKIKDAITAPIRKVREWLSNAWSAIRERAKNGFQRIKDAIVSPIEKARDLIKGIIDKIKSFFQFDFQLPHIKLPHFEISPSGWSLGDLLDGVIPSLGIDWYAKGGIFKSPSVIGVGERGPEAVLPIEKLQGMLNTMADSIVNGMTMSLAMQSAGQGGDVTIPIYLYPNGPKMGEETVRMYDKYKKILG